MCLHAMFIGTLRQAHCYVVCSRFHVSSDRIAFGGIMMNGRWNDPAMGIEDVINFPGAPEIEMYQQDLRALWAKSSC